MMKNIFRLTLALTLALAAPALVAAPAAHRTLLAKKEKPAKKEKIDKTVMKNALKDIIFITEKKPNPAAKYYIYLQASSTCAKCNQEMPNVVKQYKEMAKHKVELIFVSHDPDAETAIAFMEKYKADFPCVLADSEDAKKLPAFEATQSTPWASMLNAGGKEIQGNIAGFIMQDWKGISETGAPVRNYKKG